MTVIKKTILDLSVKDFFSEWIKVNILIYKEIYNEIQNRSAIKEATLHILHFITTKEKILFVGIDLFIVSFLLMILYQN